MHIGQATVVIYIYRGAPVALYRRSSFNVCDKPQCSGFQLVNGDAGDWISDGSREDLTFLILRPIFSSSHFGASRAF
jgi:hypothetical protein